MSEAVGTEILTAIKNIIVADSTIKSLMSDPIRFYDLKAPNKSVMPYIVVNARVLQWDTVPTETSDGYGNEVNIDIMVFTNSRVSYKLRQINQRIKELLRDAENISMVDHNLTMLRFVYESTFDDIDDNAEADQNITYGVLQFRALTEEV